MDAALTSFEAHYQQNIRLATGVSTHSGITRARSSALIYAELRLSAWAKWAKENQDKLGFPKLSMIYKVMRRHARRTNGVHVSPEMRVNALSARGVETRSLRPLSVGDVSEAISEVDRAVARIERRQQKIIHIEYLSSAEAPEEAKAAHAGLCRAEYRKALKRAKLAVAGRLI